MEFKTNWTSEDYYNADDLNRVETIIIETAELVNALFGLSVELEPTVTDRDYSRIEFAEDLNRIERNIERLMVLDLERLLTMKTNWQAGDPFSFEDANRLEYNLSVLYPILDKNSRNVVYSGTFNSGEEVI